MPLIVSNLRRDLVEISKNPPPNAAAVARRWAAAYSSYASTATSVLAASPLPASIEAAELILAATLTSVFATSRVAPLTAARMAGAFTSFWMTPPIVFPQAFPGVVTAVLGAPVLQTGLLGAWASNLASGLPVDVAMAKLAVLLDTFTRTVIVTHATVPSPTPGPIT